MQEKWSAAYNVRTVLLSIQSLLGDPNLDSPLNGHAAATWYNGAEYKKALLKHYKSQTGCAACCPHAPLDGPPTISTATPAPDRAPALAYWASDLHPRSLPLISTCVPLRSSGLPAANACSRRTASVSLAHALRVQSCAAQLICDR